MPFSESTANRLRELDNDIRANILIDTNIKDAAEKILSKVEDDKIKLKVNKIWVDQKYDNSDIEAQQDVRNKNQIWSDDLRADLSLIDKETGKEIDRVEKIKLANIPKITDRGTFLIKGNEYQFNKQSRLKPGVYTREQSNGEISSFFNVDKTIDFDRGFNNNFKINFNPERKIFTMGYGSKNVPLINALRAVGVTDDEMKKSWGDDVFESNSKAYDKHESTNIPKLYEAIYGRRPDSSLSMDKVKTEIKQRLFDTELDPETTKVTLGKSYKNVNKGALLDASKKIIDIHKGDVEGDDRESMIFKSFYDAEDHIREKLVKNSDKIAGNIKFKLGKNREINKSISSQMFDPFIAGTITTSRLSNPPNQTNPLSIIGESSKVTVLGEGGIGTTSAITNETRQISNSEAGFMDPLHTPEGSNIGVATHLTWPTFKVGNDVYSIFKTPSGKTETKTPLQTYEKTVAFPDEYDDSGGKLKAKRSVVRAIRKGKMVEVKPSEVDYIIHNPTAMFDTSANMIPFLDSIQGNRGLTASKMQEQALSLKERDKPLFKIVGPNNINMGEALAGRFATPKAPFDGEVTEVTDNFIKLKNKKGEEKKIGLYNNFSLNSESFLNNETKVKVGDKVKAGQLLADNNFTRDGEMAIGANLRVAYMPYKGYNYEDSAIMSESAAKKLTSQHMYDFKTKRTSDGFFSRDKFRAYYPEELNEAKAKKLDKDGVIKVGQKVERDDILIAHLERKAPTADDIAVGRLDKQLRRDMANNSAKWDKDNVGVVTGVKKHGNSVVVSVKTEEPLKEADKVSGLHGNKHIISKIVPDHEMPFDPRTGKYIDMTMNPIGVSNRINTSQLLENAAGKIAEATGKRYEIKNFTDQDNSRKILDDLKKAGVSDKDVLIDPETGKPFLNPIANGVSHILKLEHIVDHKFSARYKEGYDANEQPISGGHTGGKNLGRMEIAAMLARGANENLREMFSIKGQRNDEFWRAMETGQSLPPPKKAFVWDKMLANMAGAGINVTQKGKTYQLKPMTDEEILERSRGEIKDPTLTYRKKDLAPMKNGLFDPVKAGGVFGENYTHFSLPEKILNPITASATANLLDIPLKKLDSIIEGKQFVKKDTNEIVAPGTPGSLSGGPAIESMLSRIDVDKELKNAEERVNTVKNPSELNKLHRKIRYLKSMKENGMKPTDYMISNILVTPSKYRPMFSMGAEGTVIMSDINDLYQQAGFTRDALGNLKSELNRTVKDEDTKNLMLAEARGAMYKDIKAVTGLGEPTSYLHRSRDKKGYITQIDGGKEKQTKEGFFQSKVMQRRQDLVGRSTIILNPKLGGDELGIPKEMADEIFRPFIMQKLVSWGYKPLEAAEEAKNKTKVYERARQVVADERPVIANRAPTLHRWNMTAFKPILTDGKSIEVPGVVVGKNFGGDFDGDCALSNLYISINFNELQQFVRLSKKQVFFGDLHFDSSINYIDSILKHMEVNMPSVSKLITMQDEKILHLHISQFPRIEETKNVKDNGNEEYDVPSGVSIFTIDNITHEFVKIPVTKFSVHKNLVSYTIETSSKDSLLLSEDESAVAVNTSTWEIERVKPINLKNGALMPKVRNMEVESSVFKVMLKDHRKTSAGIQCRESMDLNYDTGWLIGAMVGDGWVSVESGRNDLCIASIHDSIGKKFSSVINDLLLENRDPVIVEAPHKFEGHECFSKKYTVACVSLAKNFINFIGKGALNKHLPQFYMATPEEFRYGLLSGLLDTDGTVCWLKKKNGRQFNVQYTTISEVLADQVVSLCRSLGISSSITIAKKTKSGIERRVVISTNTIHGKPIVLLAPDKSKALSEFYSETIKDSSVSARQDLVPFGLSLLSEAKKFIHFDRDKDIYRNINDAMRNNWRISRQSAKRLIALDKDNILPGRWKDIVTNESITWVYAKSVKPNTERIDMYDITAPGPYTFMLSNGIIVQDTFQIHTPISPKAIREAEKMKPSASMLKTGYDSVLNSPDNDMIIGAYLSSKGAGGKDTNMSFKDIQEARDAFKQNKFTYGDTVIINGKKAPFGVHEINSVVPDNHQKWGSILDKSTINNWIKDVSLKENGKIALGLSDKIKDVGNNYVTTFGYNLGVSDTVSDTDLQKEIIEKTKSVSGKNPADFLKVWSSSLSDAKDKLQKKHGDKTMLGIGMASGGSKGIGNTSAITFMPGIVTDANDKPIMMPITKSYSEGLDTFGYWAAAHGARGGNIKKSVSSFKPGWLTKDLINSIYETRIESDDPVDTEGLEYKVEDKKGIMNRFLARDAKTPSGHIIAKRNEVVTSDVVNRLNKHGIKSVYVQSPLTDPTPGDGFSSYSYGVDYEGKKHNIGDDIGVMSAHTITEPSLNMAMKAFHTGGALETGKGRSVGTVFDKLDRTLRFTKNIPDKATMADMDAKVEDIRKSSIGGWDVELNDGKNKTIRYINPLNEPTVKKGDSVKSGQVISTGTPSPHDMLKYRGMRETQKFLVDQIDSIDEGKLDKRNIETIVRGITNTTRVLHPGSNKDYVHGDVAPLTTVENYNKNNFKEESITDIKGDHLAEDYGSLKKHTKIDDNVINQLRRQGKTRVRVFKDRVKHEPFLTPTGIGAKAGSSEDWIARLAHNRIRKALEEGTTMGWKSSIEHKNGHPLPEYITGEYTW